jgi:hypothetical protein
MRPSRLGIRRSRTGSGRNVPARSSPRSSERNRSTPSASTWRRVAASIPAVRDPRLRLTRDHATATVAGSRTRFHRSQNLRSASSAAHACSLRWKSSTRSCARSALGNGAPVFTGDLLPSSPATCSPDPFAMWPAFPTAAHYGSSATPRRPQRTVRLPRTHKRVRRAPPGRFPRSPSTGRQGRRPAVPRGHRRAAPQHTARPRPPDQQPDGRDGPDR